MQRLRKISVSIRFCHTFAVLTLAAGSDLYTVGKLLGHTSINSTQVYADVVMETKVEAISRISNYFSNL